MLVPTWRGYRHGQNRLVGLVRLGTSRGARRPNPTLLHLVSVLRCIHSEPQLPHDTNADGIRNIGIIAHVDAVGRTPPLQRLQLTCLGKNYHDGADAVSQWAYPSHRKYAWSSPVLLFCPLTFTQMSTMATP